MNNALTISGLTKTYKDFVLDKVSFSVPEGSIVGLIGENGAGKSTTINAALGLIQKDAGYISIMGKEELDNDTKEQIGVVFDGSNYPEILSPKRLNRVMKNIYHSWDEHTYMSLLKKFSLPADKQIKQFSKGMKMKLAITVALSHNSKLLILDEATSALDSISESLIQDAIDPLLKGRTSLVIAHRLSTIMAADEILVVDQGRIVQRGTHRELVEQDGVYRELYETQFRRALEDQKNRKITKAKVLAH